MARGVKHREGRKPDPNIVGRRLAGLRLWQWKFTMPDLKAIQRQSFAYGIYYMVKQYLEYPELDKRFGIRLKYGVSDCRPDRFFTRLRREALKQFRDYRLNVARHYVDKILAKNGLPTMSQIIRTIKEADADWISVDKLAEKLGTTPEKVVATLAIMVHRGYQRFIPGIRICTMNKAKYTLPQRNQGFDSICVNKHVLPDPSEWITDDNRG